MKVLKKLFTIIFSMIILLSFAVTQEERISELERIALYEESDWIEEKEVIPTPIDAKEKFNLTSAQLLEDIITLSEKYNISETNESRKLCRKMAVSWIGFYGTTNNLPYLRNIMYNNQDFAQRNAMLSSLMLLIKEESYISLARDIVTNKVVFSDKLRGALYTSLHTRCMRGRSSNYVDDEAFHSRVAAFFLERAALEEDDTLYVDRVACELNPSYRHSQQRRDNLARLRPPGLTGEQADIYNFRERDALPKEAK